VRTIPSAAHTIGFQTARNFSAPLGFCGAGWVGIIVRVGRARKCFRRGHTYGDRLGMVAGFGERCVTERAIFDVLEQEGAAVRANLYHWSVLRCGIPVTEHRYGSTRPQEQTSWGGSNLLRVAYEATRQHSARSE
jgi:hypothetical protein